MGLFGAFWNLVKDKIVDAKEFVKEKCSKVWNKFTGKETFDKADALYEEITERYNSRRKQFESDINHYTDIIEKTVIRINEHKERIKRDLFPQMADKLSKICDVDVTDKFCFEEFEISNYSFDELRKKESLYKIDFNKHPIKSNTLAVLTLGFYTRKKAKETLYAVQEEEAKINTEIAKMDVETKRLETIEKSLSNVDKYFEDLIGIYENLLVRLDSSVNFLFVRCMSFAHKIIKKEMSVRYLSKIQIKEIESIVTASKILKAMTEMQIVSLEKKECVSKYEQSIGKQHNEIVNAYKAA